MFIRRSITFGRRYATNKKRRFLSLDKNTSKFRNWHRCNLKRNTSSGTNSAFNSVKILGVGALLLNIFDDERISNEKNRRNCVFADTSDAPKVYGRNFLADAVDEAMPSVVHIVVSSGMSLARTGVGSGFVITEDGFIVTNNHVVTSGSQYAGRNNAYKVSFADGSTYEADLYARDPKSDIAILKIRNVYNERFPAIKRGTSRGLRRGEFIIALGSPLALNHSATHGIVSCIRHTVDLGQPRVHGNSTGKLGLDDYLQMDIPANQGMSGGPVINLDGEVVGITNMLIAGSGLGGVISYAIPIDTARRIIDQLLTSRRVIRPYIGCKVKTIDKEILMKERANANGSILPNGVNEGVLVVSLHAGGQAEKGGLQMGDVIIECESRKIKNADEFVDVLNEEFLLKKNLRVVVLRGKSGTRVVLNILPDRR